MILIIRLGWFVALILRLVEGCLSIEHSLPRGLFIGLVLLAVTGWVVANVHFLM